MRTKIMIFVVATALVATACGGKTPPQLTPVAPVPGATVQDELIRQRALEIEATQVAKKAEKAKRENWSPAMKEAARELERADKRNASAQREAARAISRANIQGCPAGSVWVSPTVEDRAFGFLNAKVTVVNLTTAPVNIRDMVAGFEVVRNLCPGGQMTMVKRFIMGDSYQKEVAFLATSYVGGKVHTAYSPVVYLSAYSLPYGPATQAVTWEIRF